MAIPDSNSDVRAYLHELQDAAEEYIGHKKFNAVQFFYRNKPEKYFETVKQHSHTMAKLKKDRNGDRRSPINNKLSGVFLGVTLSGGLLPTASPFGNTRIQFPIEALFNSTTRLYFTDFYCSTSKQHYVTIVMTKQHSSEDYFCQEKLIKLDPETNPFLRMRNTGPYEQPSFQTINKPGLIIEVFYTEKINIGRLMKIYGTDRVFYSRSDIIGKGTSTWGGLRKNESCTHCNPSLRMSRGVRTGYQRVSPTRSSPTRSPPTRSSPTRSPPTRSSSSYYTHTTTYYDDGPASDYQPFRNQPQEEGNKWPWLLVGLGALALGWLARKFE